MRWDRLVCNFTHLALDAWHWTLSETDCNVMRVASDIRHRTLSQIGSRQLHACRFRHDTEFSLTLQEVKTVAAIIVFNFLGSVWLPAVVTPSTASSSRSSFIASISILPNIIFSFRYGLCWNLGLISGYPQFTFLRFFRYIQKVFSIVPFLLFPLQIIIRE